MWVCADPNVLYHVLILCCLLWFQLQILHPSTKNGTCFSVVVQEKIFWTLVTLPLPRGIGSLCFCRRYRHRTEPPFFLPCYTKLPLVFPSSCIPCFLPLPLPMTLGVLLSFWCLQKTDEFFYWDLVLIRTCGHTCLCMGPHVMLCSMFLSLSLLEQICFYIWIAGKVLIGISCS